MLAEYRLYGRILHDRSNHVITNPQNGAYICFLSVDDPEKIKSTEWNDIWMEEASDFTWDDWLILQTRLSGRRSKENPNKIYLSLNPSDEQGWINQRLMVTKIFAEKLEIIKSTYRDNPFLGTDYVALLQSLKEQDINAYQVFAEGEWGTLTNVIYNPYEMLAAFPSFGDDPESIYGVDFGFNNPSAVIKITIKDIEHCYLEQILYKTHLTNADLIRELEAILPEDEKYRNWYGDCAEPDRIEEFKRSGFHIYESDKEVEIGIDFCKRHKFYTLPGNVDLNKERATYKWKTDKNGNVLEEPVKYMDHLMDGKRYALYTYQKDIVDTWDKWIVGRKIA